MRRSITLGSAVSSTFVGADFVEEPDQELAVLALLHAGERLPQLLQLHWPQSLDIRAKRIEVIFTMLVHECYQLERLVSDLFVLMPKKVVSILEN